MPSSPRPVAVVAFDDCQLLDVAGPLQAFATATELAPRHGSAGYAPTLYTLRGGAVRTSAGLTLVARPLARARLDARSIVLLAGGRGVTAAARTPALLAWIRRADSTAARVCSVCSGAFLLAATGLADGHAVATHWAHCDELAARYPRVVVDRDSIFVQSGRYWTSAGVTAGIDLALALIEADEGRTLAMAAARQLVVFFKRPGGQGQFSELLAAQSRESDRFAGLHAWISTNLDRDIGIEKMAAHAGMSVRNFHRYYRREMGATPAAAVERMRVEAARRLLEDGRKRIRAIAASVGFASEETMRRAFLRQIGVSPSNYRRGFARGSRAGKAAIARPASRLSSASSARSVHRRRNSTRRAS